MAVIPKAPSTKQVQQRVDSAIANILRQETKYDELSELFPEDNDGRSGVSDSEEGDG